MELKLTSIYNFGSYIKTNLFECHQDYLQFDKDFGEVYDPSCIQYKILLLIEDSEIFEDDFYVSSDGAISKCDKHSIYFANNTTNMDKSRFREKIIKSNTPYITPNSLFTDTELEDIAKHYNEDYALPIYPYTKDQLDEPKNYIQEIKEPEEPVNYFKAFIRVVKSLNKDIENQIGNSFYRSNFDSVEIIREPLIKAKDKKEVKEYLLNKYPQFFQNGKVYEKETKDQAQFFYTIIFPLYQHEINLINEGNWTCDYCGQIHENTYVSRPLRSKKFDGKIFCNIDYLSGNDIVSVPDCYEKWKKEVAFQNIDLPDDLNYINTDSLNYIYKCTEKSTGKSYIGKTRNAPFFRWWNHLSHSSSPFGLYLRQTKLSEWTFEVLEELPSNIEDKEVFKVESSYILKYDSINNGFNTVISNKSIKKEN